MTERRARRLAWWAFALCASLVVLSITFDLATKLRPRQPSPAKADLAVALIFAAFPIVAILILTRQPRNRIGWILMAISLGWTSGALGDYGTFALSRGLPLGAVALSLSGPTWAPPIVLMGTSLLLRFPNGELLSRRWRKVEWLALFAIAVVFVVIVFSPGHFMDEGYTGLKNPLGVEALKPVLDAALFLFLLIPITMVASAASLIMRFRRSRGVERMQMKWLATAAALVAALYLVTMVASFSAGSIFGGTDPTWVSVLQNLIVFFFILIPIAIGFAILKYRLYDIDVVINKTLVYGAMAGFITAVYVAIVVGIGHAVGSARNLGLSIAATALVAVAFQPVRERVQRLANRVVYGTRATPYEVLPAFSGGMAQTVATEDLLPRMARIVAEGTAAARAEVWLRVGPELVREASWPELLVPQAIPVPAGEEVAVPGMDAAVAVRHQGELLGVIALAKARGEALTPGDTKLLSDLASQAGLVLRNVRLIEELRTSRQRLVTAQDSERRRLERDLHDGAQQRLVSVALALRTARKLVTPEGDPLAERLDQASEQMAEALAELRELARGIHPAILTERGLGPAVASLAHRSAVPVTVEASLEGRLPAAVEATGYFVAAEGLTNVAKYARATAATVRIAHVDGELSIEVCDDGVGGADASRGSGLRGLADRVAAVDGRLEVHSPPGQGTRLKARIPISLAATASPAAPT